MDIVKNDNFTIKIENVLCSFELKTIDFLNMETEMCYLNVGDKSFAVGFKSMFDYFFELKKGGKI